MLNEHGWFLSLALGRHSRSLSVTQHLLIVRVLIGIHRLVLVQNLLGRSFPTTIILVTSMVRHPLILNLWLD